MNRSLLRTHTVLWVAAASPARGGDGRAVHQYTVLDNVLVVTDGRTHFGAAPPIRYDYRACGTHMLTPPHTL
jgi:hypothetical protein